MRGRRGIGGVSRFWRCALACGSIALAVGVASCGGSSGGPPPLRGSAVWFADAGIPLDDPDPANPFVAEYTVSQLANQASPDIAPHKTIFSDAFVAPQDPLFDSRGNLWVVDGGDGDTSGEFDSSQSVYEFSSTQLAQLPAGVSPAPIDPAIGIATAGFVFPQFAAFDRAGNMWVSDSGANEIFKFTPDQLSAGGQVTEAAVLQDGEFDSPVGLAFDKNGNLWVANNGEASDLLLLGASDLAAASGTSPISSIASFGSVTTPQGTQSLESSWGLSFDGGGNLWVTNEQPSFQIIGPGEFFIDPQGTIVEFSASTVADASGISTPQPTIVLTPLPMDGTTSILAPNGVAVDKLSKRLFYANSGDPTQDPPVDQSLAGFNLSGLVSGSLTPSIFVNGAASTLENPRGLTVGPAF